MENFQFPGRHLQEFFAQKYKKFWEDGIMKLPEKHGRR